MNNYNSQKPPLHPHRSDLQPLIEFLNSFFPLGEEINEFLFRHSFPRKISKGKFLLKPGDICNHYYYIHKGILRSFLKVGNKDITVWINPEGEVTTSIRSMRRSEPSTEYIQALEDCELIAMSYESMQEMYARFPEMNRIGRMLLEEYYADSEERVFIGRIPDASSRYEHFIKSRPDLVNRIPLKVVASYLGITLETLSRLRAKQASRPKARPAGFDSQNP